MSSPETFSADYLYLTLRPSRLQCAFNLVVHLGGFAALWYNPLFPVSLKLALSVALVVSGAQLPVRLIQANNANAVDEVLLRAGSWKLHFRDGRWQGAELFGPLHVGYLFVILAFRSGGKTFRVVVGRDSCNPDTFRRLSVLCRYAGSRIMLPG